MKLYLMEADKHIYKFCIKYLSELVNGMNL